MTDQRREPDVGDPNSVAPSADRPPQTPRWVWILLTIVLVPVLLLAVMVLTGGHAPPPGAH